VAVPFPLSVKVIPAGSAPDSDRAATGKPLVWMVMVEAVPVLAVAVVALVKAGVWLTVRVKAWVVLPFALVTFKVKA
jgi:hypothetical protein